MVSDSKRIGTTNAYHPCNGVATQKQELLLFLTARQLEVGEEIADEFAAFHAERCEAVGCLRGADSECVSEFVCIEISVMRVRIEREIGRIWKDAQVQTCVAEGDCSVLQGKGECGRLVVGPFSYFEVFSIHE